MGAIVVVLNWKNGVLNAIVEGLNLRDGVLNSKVAVLDSNDGVTILEPAIHNLKLGQICSKHGVLISVVEWASPTLLLDVYI